MPVIYFTEEQLKLTKACLEFHAGAAVDLIDHTGIANADTLLPETINTIDNQIQMALVKEPKKDDL